MAIVEKFFIGLGVVSAISCCVFAYAIITL